MVAIAETENVENKPVIFSTQADKIEFVENAVEVSNDHEAMYFPEKRFAKEVNYYIGYVKTIWFDGFISLSSPNTISHVLRGEDINKRKGDVRKKQKELKQLAETLKPFQNDFYIQTGISGS